MQLEKVLFVIVLYKQELKSTRAYKSLEPLIAANGKKISLFVYDNSPGRTTDSSPCTVYIHDPSNPGVSAAYNKAFLFAKERGLEFLLLMDQDSFFPRECLVSYSHAVANNPNQHVFAPTARNGKIIYSPFRMIRGRGLSTSLNAGIYTLRKISIINSGMLVSLHAFEKSGGYDERFPLDFSDIDFCERLANHHFNLCLIDAFILHDHSSSEKTDSRFRFDTYLKAVKLFKTVSNQNISYWFAGFPRAAKLSTQLGDSWFLQRFFQLRA